MPRAKMTLQGGRLRGKTVPHETQPCIPPVT